MNTKKNMRCNKQYQNEDRKGSLLYIPLNPFLLLVWREKSV